MSKPNNIQKIVPHLWFDNEANDAMEFYISVFPNSKLNFKTTLDGTPSGKVEIVSFDVCGYEFQAISAGPYFKPNPAISFMINFDPSQDEKAKERIDEVWNKLILGGKVLMPMDEYPFSDRYGWIEDRYGVSWQLILTKPEGEKRPAVIPSFLFVTETGEKAEEATDFYLSVFRDTKRGAMVRYPSGMQPNKEGAIMFTDFKLEDQWFVAMDGVNDMHNFSFTPGVSLMVRCDTQEEIDYYWERLSAVPEAEQCGWLTDRYGVSWQIVPTKMDEMLTKGTEEQKTKVTEAFLKMKKFDIETLVSAYNS